MSINFISSKDSDETCTIHTKRDNIEIMIGSETDEIIDELFKSFLQRYQEGEESMKESKLIFDSVNLLHYHFQKTSLKRTGSSYIDSPECLKTKKSTNPKNNDDNSFQYTLTNAVNYLNIKSHPERIYSLKPFINQYNRRGINFPLHEDWKKCESNNNLG